jgi:hypothetical protein
MNRLRPRRLASRPARQNRISSGATDGIGIRGLVQANQRREGGVLAGAQRGTSGLGTLDSRTVLRMASTAGSAILDRLLHHSITVNVKGESYRPKESSKPDRSNPNSISGLGELCSALRSPYPAGAGSATILRGMPANSRRVNDHPKLTPFRHLKLPLGFVPDGEARGGMASPSPLRVEPRCLRCVRGAARSVCATARKKDFQTLRPHQMRNPARPGAAGNTVNQNRLKPCRGRPFGLYGELESESQNDVDGPSPVF